jgi:serine/threonine-protein kinase haspin
VKASHLRQARFRKGTPFRRVPRISLNSTLTLSPISPLNITGKIGAAAGTRTTKNTRPAEQPPLPPSSPLTWDESITPETVRILDFTSDDEEQGSSAVAIERLLKLAEQTAPVEFATFLETFRTRDIDEISSTGRREKARSVQRTSLKYRKIGDASYSEVFAIGDLVLKVIPLAVEMDEENSVDSEDLDDDEVPFKSSPENVLKEIVITKATGDVVDGFIKLLRYTTFCADLT